MLNTSIFYKVFTLLIIIALFFFAFSYLEKKQAEQKFDFLITQFLQANPEIKSITYSDLNTNLLWALEGEYAITNLVITAQNPIYNFHVGSIFLHQMEFKTIKIPHGTANQLQSAHINFNDVFLDNINQLAPGLPPNFGLLFSVDLRYLNRPETQTQEFNIIFAIYQELTELQARQYGYQFSSVNPNNTFLYPFDQHQLRLAGNKLFRELNNATRTHVKIINNPKLNQSYLITINPNQNIIHKIYKQTLEQELQNLNQLDKNLKIIQDSPAYQAALAYLLANQSQTLTTLQSLDD